MPPFSGLTERFKKTFAPAINAVSNFVAQPTPNVYSAPKREQSTAPASSSIPASTSPAKVSAPTPTALPQQTGVQLDPRFQGMSAGAIQDTLENERRQRARGGGVDVTPSIGDTVDSSALSPDNTVDSLTAANQKRMQDLFARFDESESEKQAQTRINELLDTRNSLESRKKKAVANLMKNTEGLTERGLERVVRAEEAAFDDQIADIDTQITGFQSNIKSAQEARTLALQNAKMVQELTGEQMIGSVQTDPVTGEQSAYFQNPVTGELSQRVVGQISVSPEDSYFNLSAGERRYRINPDTGQAELVASAPSAKSASSGGGFAGFGLGGQATDSGVNLGQLETSFSRAVTGLPLNQRQYATGLFYDMINSGDTQGAYDYTKQLIIDSLPADAKNKVIGRNTALAAIESIERDLQEFENMGGSTGFFTGSLESITNKIGKTSDPRLAEIANRIALQIQAYRQAVSGQGFTTSESSEYINVFPGIGKSGELNQAKINSVKREFTDQQNQIFSAYNLPVSSESTGDTQMSEADKLAVFNEIAGGQTQEKPATSVIADTARNLWSGLKGLFSN